MSFYRKCNNQPVDLVMISLITIDNDAEIYRVRFNLRLHLTQKSYKAVYLVFDISSVNQTK